MGMIAADGPQTPKQALVTAILMQAYRDLFAAVKSDGAAALTTQSDQDRAIYFLTDRRGEFAWWRNHYCSFVGIDGDVLAERVRSMMEGEEFPQPSADSSASTRARHKKQQVSLRARWRYLKNPTRSQQKPQTPVDQLSIAS